MASLGSLDSQARRRWRGARKGLAVTDSVEAAAAPATKAASLVARRRACVSACDRSCCPCRPSTILHS